MYKMQCQLCASFGDARFKFDGLPVESLRKHSKIHQLQIGRISKRDRKIRPFEKKIFDRCFPNVISSAGTKTKNVETEIARRRRRGRMDMVDGSNGGSIKKRRVRNSSGSTKQETAITASILNLESPAPQKCGKISTQEKTKSEHCHRHGIAALRSHCRELRRKFAHNGKLTCHECSTTMVVATNIINAVDHVTRCHFGQELYACRSCSKRYTAYFAIGQHINKAHHQSPDDACIDLSGEYENEIMELMTKCYGRAAMVEDGNCQIGNASARKKRSTISAQATRKRLPMKSGASGGHGIMALRSHCHELTRKVGKDGKMTCSQCSAEVVVKNSHITSALDHVTRFHFDRKLYACRLCSKRYSAHGTLAKHSRDIHQKSPTVTFIDLSEQFENEIMELLTKCYGASTKVGENTKKFENINVVSRNSVTTVAIGRCFGELKRNFGKLTCRICANHYGLVDGLAAVSHIGRVHLRKCLFTCRLCSKGLSDYRGTQNHVRRTHGKAASGNYECHTKQYEKEIIEWMVTCFGEAEKTSQKEGEACQLCAAFGDARFIFDGLPMESLRKHSILHELQIDRISKGQRKTRSWEQKIFNRCFPNVTAGAGTKAMNAETEIVGRRRRGSKTIDGNNGSKKKRRNRQILENTEQETASANVECPAPKKCGGSSIQHTTKSCGCGHGIVALRRHCRELKRNFSLNGKLTCRQCSTKLTVSSNVTIAVDHVTRCHFGQQLYACRLCSKRYMCYKSVAEHVCRFHHRSPLDAFIDQCEDYENDIIELMTKCYGGAAKTSDGNSQIKKTSASEKCGTTSTQPPCQLRIMKSGGCGCHGVGALRKHCFKLKRNANQGEKMTCRQCSTELVIRKDATNAVDHVTRHHFGRNLYACRLCSKRFSGYHTLIHHARRVHQKSPTLVFIDLSEEYETEIIELLTQCYGASTKEGDNIKKVGNFNTGTIPVAIRRCLRELKRDFASDGNLACRICAQQEIPAASPNVVSHIGRVHFGKSLFTCRLCSKGFCYYFGIRDHVRSTHAKGASGNYDCHTKQYEKEIIAWMVTCFGEAEKTGEEAGVQNSD